MPIRGEAFFPQPRNYHLPSLLFCHGIPAGETISSQRKKGYVFWGRFFARHGYPTVLFNFRGTGESGGNLNLKEWAGDLQEVIDGYTRKVDPSCPGLVLVGFSAGAAVAVEAAAVDSRVKAAALGACPAHFNFFFEALTLDGVLAWMKNVGFFREAHYPSDPEQWQKDFLSVRPEEKIHLLSPRPVLFLQGQEDDMVPWQHAQKLYEKAGIPKKLVTFPRLGHRLRSYPRVFYSILKWLYQLT